VFSALLIPIVWLTYSLVRGAYMAAYPYDFLDVATYGLGPVLTTVAMIIAFGVALGFVFLGLDRALGRRAAVAATAGEARAPGRAPAPTSAGSS
jgi:hypothetical protein